MVDRNEALREMARRELARRQGGGAAAPSNKSYTGSFLPFSRNAEGEVSFDSNAGILGALKDAFMLPGDAMAGKVDPTSQEGIERAFNFAGAVSPINPMARSGERVVPGVAKSMRKVDVEPPTQDMLREAAKHSYDELRDLGVDYSTASVNSLSGEIQAGLTQDGIIGTLAPKTYSVLDQLSAAPEGSVASLNGLTAARKAFGNAAKDFSNPTEQLAAQRAIESLDGFLARSDPASVVAGSADEVAPLLRDANGNYGAYKRSQKLTDLTDAAQLRANAANSGANAGNTTRQRLASLILNGRGKEIAGFSKDEVAALRGVNEGSIAANSTRRASNLLGGGGGLGASLVGALTGAAAAVGTGNPWMGLAGIAAPVVGAGSRAGSNALTERALSQVERNVRKRSPLYEEMLKTAPLEGVAPNRTAALMRLIMLGGNSQAGGGGGW